MGIIRREHIISSIVLIQKGKKQRSELNKKKKQKEERFFSHQKGVFSCFLSPKNHKTHKQIYHKREREREIGDGKEKDGRGGVGVGGEEGRGRIQNLQGLKVSNFLPFLQLKIN